MNSAARPERRPPLRRKSPLNTPAARRHAERAEAIEAHMRQYGIEPERVLPTMDEGGHIRMDFKAMDWILTMLDAAYDGEPPTEEELADLAR